MREEPPLSSTRESPCTAMKTPCSHQSINQSILNTLNLYVMQIPQQDYGSIRMVVQWCGSICLGLSVPGSWLLHTLASSHQGPEGAVMIRYTWTKIKLGATDLWLWIPGFHRIQTSWHRSALWNTDRHCAALNLSFYFYQVWKATLSNTICQLHLDKNEKKRNEVTTSHITI